MNLTLEGEALIKSSEGLRLAAYLCPAGVWTIGYGHTGPDVYKGLIITVARAEELFRQDATLNGAILLNILRGVRTTDRQFSAMLSLMYNIGSAAFKDSTVFKKHMLSLAVEAAAAFLMWNKITVNGVKVVSSGLVIRRNAEKELYLQ